MSNAAEGERAETNTLNTRLRRGWWPSFNRHRRSRADVVRSHSARALQRSLRRFGKDL